MSKRRRTLNKYTHNNPQEFSKHTMTVDDWKAFYIVTKLTEQVALYGEKALRSFIKAMVKLEAA